MKYLKSINEYRNQLEIPFDNKHPLYDKPAHIHIIDYLLSISSKFVNIDNYNTPFNKSHVKKIWDDNYKLAYKEFFENEILSPEDEYMYQERFNFFLKKYPIYNDNNYQYYSFDTTQKVLDLIGSGMNKHKIIKHMDFILDDDSNSYLSDIGLELFDSLEFNELFFEDRLKKNKLYNGIINNITNNGVMKVWRGMSFNKGNEVDIYTNALNYKGIGVYWTWDINKAESYWSDNDDDYILHGLVNPDNVNWVNTIFKNAYSLNFEKEIELIKNKDILIYKVTYKKNQKTLPLKTPVIIRL